MWASEWLLVLLLLLFLLLPLLLAAATGEGILGLQKGEESDRHTEQRLWGTWAQIFVKRGKEKGLQNANTSTWPLTCTAACAASSSSCLRRPAVRLLRKGRLGATTPVVLGLEAGRLISVRQVKKIKIYS